MGNSMYPRLWRLRVCLFAFFGFSLFLPRLTTPHLRCDNCKGSFEDISTRMDEFRDRNFINGWERTKAVWTVPQGFGNETFVLFYVE